MDGPERLEDEARPARRATWRVVAVVVSVVAALGAVRFSGVLPSPPSPTTPPTPAPAVSRLAAWPEGIGGGTLYVLARAGVAMVDVASGRFRRSGLEIDPAPATLAPGGPGVLVWFEGGDGTPHLVSAGSAATPTVGPLLAQARRVLPGPGDNVWTSDGVGPGAGSTARWRLLSVDGTVLSTVPLTGTVAGDGAGGLFVRTDGGRVVHVVDGSPRTTWRGRTGAVGLDGWEAVRCTGRRCAAALHDRSSGAETPLARVTSSELQTPVLSLTKRFVASIQSSPDDGGDRPAVRVAVPGSAQVLCSFAAAPDGANALVWLSDRWLAATGEEGLVLYDAVDDRLVPLGPELVGSSRLVLRPV